MSQFEGVRPRQLEYSAEDKAIFHFFNTVYAWMAVGLGVTAVVSYSVAAVPALHSMMVQSPFVAIIAGIGAFLLAISAQRAALRISASAGLALFLIYAAVIGVLIANIFVLYSMSTIGGAFVLTGGVFGGMSLYGFVTKRDLTGIGSFLIMGLWGLILASVVNIFLANSALDWIITYAILAVFMGLTAYQTQMLKSLAVRTAGSPDLSSRYAIIGSLILYIAFINMFLSILQIMNGGGRRR